MIEILEMVGSEINDLINRVGYGHLGCSRCDQPYVLPIHYASDGTDIFIYTTVGLKSETLKLNPKVCLQIEEISPDGLWKSVVLTGEAEELVDRVEREKAVELIRSTNPTLMPALAIKWSHDWLRKDVEVVYKITILKATGRMSSEVRIATASAVPDISCVDPQL